MGDIADIIYRDRLAFAVFADCGPRNLLGEGSIALHRALGHETIVAGKLVNEGIDSGLGLHQVSMESSQGGADGNRVSKRAAMVRPSLLVQSKMSGQ